jgi:hypothetical protein
VRSSISSSDRAPSGPWRRTWLVAIGLAMVALGALETGWRAAGHRPGPIDDSRLWAAARLRLGSGPRAVAILGDSRALFGIDLGALQSELDAERPTQLAIQGSTPVPILLDLARDEAFRGLALVAVSPVRFFDASDDSSVLPRQYLGDAAQIARSPAVGLEVRIHATLQSASVLRRIELSPLVLLRTRRLPEPRAVPFDRSLRSHIVRDERMRTRERRRTGALGRLPLPDPEALEVSLATIAQAVRQIEGRGGRVALARLPSSHLHRRLERERTPRDRFWDALVHASEALAIHFEDHPELSRYECPDGSHLDAADAPPFTRALAGRIRSELARIHDSRFE